MFKFEKFSKINKFSYLIILCVLILCVSIFAPSFARFKNRNPLYDISVWDGTVANSYHSGSGTASDPYIISNGSELAYFSSMLKTNDYSDTYFTLSNDIVLNQGVFGYDLTTGVNYTAEGNTYYVEEYGNHLYDSVDRVNVAGTVNLFTALDGFKGVFNGDYHTIYGLYLTSSEENLALFTNLEGDIENLYVSNSMVYGGNLTGGVASNATNSSISNVIFSGNVIGKDTPASKSISNPLEDLSFTVTNDTKNEVVSLNLPVIEGMVTSKKISGKALIEGDGVIQINGTVVNGDFEIDLTSLQTLSITYSSTSTATFTLTDLTYQIDSSLSTSGGIVAVGHQVSLTNTVNKGYIYGSTISGGLVGQTNGCTISQSYNTGTIQSANLVAGIIGSIYQSEQVNVSKTYHTGELIGTTVGGIVSIIDENPGSIQIENSFNASNYPTLHTINHSTVTVNHLLYTTSGCVNGTTSGELTPISLEEMKNKDYLITTLGFNEYVSSDDVDANSMNVWLYDEGIPILYIDDLANPLARLHVANYSWDNFTDNLNNIKFTSPVAFSIEQVDSLRPFKEVYYYISEGNTPLTKNDMETLTWTPYTGIVELNTDGIFVIYAKVVDMNGHTSYLNTDVIVYDTTKADVTLTLSQNTWSEYKTGLDRIYIDDETPFTIEAQDNLSGVQAIDYYIASEELTDTDLDSIEEGNWTTYSSNAYVTTPGKNIIYVRVTDNYGDFTYINSDYIYYSGYQNTSLTAGQGISGDKIYITDSSSVTMNFQYTDDLTYQENYTHNLISNILLPVNTKITLIDQHSKKIYSYKITTSEDIFHYQDSCSAENCSKYATYPFTLFSEVGKENNEFFTENYTGNINESFTVMVDFSQTEMTSDYENVALSLELRDQDQIVIPTLKDSIKSFNIYTSTNIIPYIQSDFTSTIEYNSNSVNSISLDIGLLQESKDNIPINNTTYEDMDLGLGIKMVDSQGNIVSKEHLKNMKFMMDNQVYTPESDGVVRINLNSGLASTTKTLTIETSRGDLDLASGTYFLKLYSYASYDGVYSTLTSNEISIGVSVNGSTASHVEKFDVHMDNVIKYSDKKIDLGIDYAGGLTNPNVRVSLYKKEQLTAYNQDYVLVDLADYLTDSLVPASDNAYYLISNLVANNSITLNTKQLDCGGYLFVFELYDGDNRIGSLEKKFIVRY